MSEPNGKQTMFLALSIVGVLATLVGGAWVIIDQKVENAVLKATQAQREELASIRGAAQANEALLTSRLVEIETQFRAEDQIRNVQWADMRRTMAMLWRKSYAEPYPETIQFYPSIAQPSK